MENMNTDSGFKYTYSAKEQDEIKRIRQKYQTQEENGINRLRRLDAEVTSKATGIALTVGIVGTLTMGTGMSLIMTELSAILGMTELAGMVIGLVAGAVGIIMVALAYPIYGKVIKKEREKIAPEILRLSEELMK